MIDLSERDNSLRRFEEDRFGMFIHWGLYAVSARQEWIQSYEKLTKEQYRRYFDRFDPKRYDPRAWVRAAKDAGCRYAVLTTKHHDGFCLFDSDLTDFKATNGPAGRDLVREYVDAFRAEGLGVGFYYSLVDWNHDDYPAYGKWPHPMSDNEAFKDKEHRWDRYVAYMHGQVRELLTRYGKIDYLFFDFSFGEFKGEKWGATELVRMIRGLQPGILINNRLGADLFSDEPEAYAGDFESSEQILPPERMRTASGKPIPWEACVTMNEHWGYCAHGSQYKTAAQLVRGLVESVSKGGNFLLNVGPNAYGEIPAESLRLLAEIGAWMRDNGDGIYGCTEAAYPKPDWGRFTQRGDKLYAHIFERPIGPIALRGMNGKIRFARLLSDGSEVRVIRPWNVDRYPDDAFLAFHNKLEGNEAETGPNLPNAIDTVVELELSTEID